jgi:hypothetical protein
MAADRDHRISQPAASSDRSKRTTAPPTGGRKDHNTADTGQLPAGPAVPAGLGWHLLQMTSPMPHAYLPA